jgi:hypothetical protein
VSGRRSPASATGQRSLVPAAGRDSPTPAMGQRLHAPAVVGRSPAPVAAMGRRTPASVTLAGSRMFAVSTETSGQTAPRVQVDPRATPSGQSSGGVGVPWARRSGTGKCSLSSLSE